MSLFARRIHGLEKRIMSLSELDALMDRVYYGLPTSSGQYVNVDTALQANAVWSCVQAISNTVATLPFILYRDLPQGGKERNTGHRLYNLLKNSPNPEMTAREYWQMVVSHRLTWGNHYSQIVRDDYGARELWPLDPSRVKIVRDPDTRELRYVYRKTFTENITFDFSEIFHVKGDTLDGVKGLSPIAYQRQAIGVAIAAEEFAARYYGNGSTPGGVLETAGKLSKEAAARLKADWERLHAGTSNAHRVAILEEGLTWKQISIPAEDSQFLETQKASREIIASIFRVPPHKIGLLEHTNRASIEEQNIEWVVDTIWPECVRIEQAVSRDLINIGDGKRGVYAEFDLDRLLRGNAQAQAAAYATGRQWGWFCVDDIREKLGMNPLPNGEGKTFIVPLNMVPAGAEGTANNTPVPDSGPAEAPKTEDDPPESQKNPNVLSPNARASRLADLLTVATSGANGRH